MSNRAQRRAAERPSQKLAANASKVISASVGSRADQPPPPDTFNFQDLIVAQLQTLQKDRLDQRKSEIALSIKQGPGFNPADCGFDFSSDELRYYLDRTATQFRLLQTRPAFDKLIAAYRAAPKGPQAA
jgi:hypothetical protein